MNDAGGILSFLPLILVSAIFSIFTYKVAEKTGQSKLLYVFITLIPGIGTIFLIYLVYATILKLLDEVNRLKEKCNAE